MKDTGGRVLNAIGTFFLCVILVVFIYWLYVYVKPFFETGYVILPKTLQLPFELLGEVFSPANKVVILGVGEDTGGISFCFPLAGVFFLFIVYLFVRLLSGEEDSGNNES
jgi:hypothetical protein